MIEEPKLIRIKRNTPRPTAAQIAALGNVPTGVVNDALWGRGALHKDIKPVDPYGQMGAHAVGAALTVETGPADILALLASFGLYPAGGYCRPILWGASGLCRGGRPCFGHDEKLWRSWVCDRWAHARSCGPAGGEPAQLVHGADPCVALCKRTRNRWF